MSASRGAVLLAALPAVLVLGPAAVAADEPSSPPVSLPITSASGPPSATAPPLTSVTSAATTAASTHRATTSSAPTRHTTSTYRPTRTRSVVAPYSISESHTGGPTQTFVLGTGSLASLAGTTTPAASVSPVSGSSTDDSTDHYVHLFFGVVIAAALLLAAGITGLVLTRDGRTPGGRHR